MALNQERDGIINYNPLDIYSFKGIFIDVREKSDAESKPLKVNALNIPFSGIRKKIKNFDPDQDIIFICTKGGRSYESARFFSNNGFKHVAYLGGGSLLLNELYMVNRFEEALL
jgi:rhodanese-related sulfurtransferase